MTWRHTEHLCIIGDTGSGKTYLTNRLLKLRSYVIFFRTKAEQQDPMDRTWRRVSDVREISTLHGHWLLDPGDDAGLQAHQGRLMFERARREGNWTLCIDELLDAVDLDLQREVRWGMTRGRGRGITMVCGIQRPTTQTGLMPFVLSQSSHACVFAIDGRDAENIVYKSLTPQLKPVLPALDWERHQFAYYNKRQRTVTVQTANTITRELGG